MDLDSGVGVGVGIGALSALKRELAELLGVDVVPAETLKARIRVEVLAPTRFPL